MIDENLKKMLDFINKLEIRHDKLFKEYTAIGIQIKELESKIAIAKEILADIKGQEVL